MTLISAYSYNGAPILFGDLLITGPTSSDHLVYIPALGDVSDFFGNNGWGVSELRQKVNIISNTCAIAWAGSYVGAMVAINGLRNLSSSKNLTCEEILKYLEAEPELKQHHASFVGLNYCNNQLQQFHWRADTLSTTPLGTIYMCGSGSHVIQEFVNLQANIEWRSTGEVNPLISAVASGLTLGGMLLHSEYTNGDVAPTILHAFGGGYEIAFLSEGIIQKLPEITYIFWEASLTPDAVKLSPPLFILKQEYFRDYLLIQSAQCQPDLNSSCLQIVNEQRQVIKPLFEPEIKISADMFKTRSFQSRLFCHCISIYSNNQSLGIYSRIQGYSPISEMSISITDINNQIVFGFRQDLIVEICKAIERYRLSPTK